jgi:choline-glycine betaine transporter
MNDILGNLVTKFSIMDLLSIFNHPKIVLKKTPRKQKNSLSLFICLFVYLFILFWLVFCLQKWGTTIGSCQQPDYKNKQQSSFFVGGGIG